ncbi:Protein PET117, mitochondrial [Hondaea fermentalgiana]|uniref:Protein PET117, mitochondrial n=1 Tax=Hondaea fermentalgiana TaxID=2315210 RepID=A0A2R5GL68_9STRA|nr:Protein PET117, mitochondrial [Hondaea fermentalgiana]|eukprot:GBG29021.1 Protein PET117, mitochondrial [Hondaea fermentalgiana]
MALGASCVFTAATMAYVHWAQENDRWVMYQNVLHDIEQEKAELLALQQAVQAKNKGAVATADCPTGLCDLKQTRMVEPDTASS